MKTIVLIVAGKYDFGAPYFLWNDFGKQMPDYTFYLFEDAGYAGGAGQIRSASD